MRCWRSFAKVENMTSTGRTSRTAQGWPYAAKATRKPSGARRESTAYAGAAERRCANGVIFSTGRVSRNELVESKANWATSAATYTGIELQRGACVPQKKRTSAGPTACHEDAA